MSEKNEDFTDLIKKDLIKKTSKEEKLKIFGSNLKRLREQASMTKSAVAKAVGIIPQQYYRYEDGASEPGVIMAMKLSSLYGVSVQDLFEGMDDKKERILRTVRELNEFGVKAEPTRSGEIAIHIIRGLPAYLPVDLAEALIQETVNDIEPAVKNNFANAIEKNLRRHLFKN